MTLFGNYKVGQLSIEDGNAVAPNPSTPRDCDTFRSQDIPADDKLGFGGNAVQISFIPNHS